LLAGFLFDVPNHVSDTQQNITVSAVKQADNSLACVPAFANTSKTVNFACAYSNPASGTLPVTVGGSAVSCGTSGGVSLSFDATGVASTTVRYADVGQISLTANYSGSGDSAGLVMTGSDPFIAAPASFSVSGITAGPITAGNNFSATVTALNASGDATPNFGNETAPEGVMLTPTLVSPVGGNNSALANGVIAGTVFSNGVATLNNLSWGEVGNITLDAALTSGSYLGSGLDATGSSATVGAFIPDHFDTAVVQTATTPMPCPAGLACPASNDLQDGFVYSGQPFSVRVIARNLAGDTTANYAGAFAKLVTLSAAGPEGGAAISTGGTLDPNAIAAADFTAGVATLATPAYIFDAAATAPTNIFVRAIDTDNVSSLRAPAASSVEGGVTVASGRIRLSNGHGSELLPLPLTATVQFFNGTNWVTSTTDSVTSFNTATDIAVNIVKGPLAGVNVVGAGAVTVVGGRTEFTLGNPNVAGSADISLTMPNYLLAGSNGAGVNPSRPGRATFGVYKGNNEFIYLRENY
jgi:MSHA biogenesis protein MshQ